MFVLFFVSVFVVLNCLVTFANELRAFRHADNPEKAIASEDDCLRLIAAV
jgi:hypothetical protein